MCRNPGLLLVALLALAFCVQQRDGMQTLARVTWSSYFHPHPVTFFEVVPAGSRRLGLPSLVVFNAVVELRVQQR
ncbi:hypothetical protein MRX96_025250 [Rhipicephalus microplus]